MNIFQLARLPRVALMAEYRRTLARSDVTAIRRVQGMSREALVAAIAGDPDRGRSLRAMARAERREMRWRELRDRRHVA